MTDIIEKSLEQFIRRFFEEKKGNYDFFIGSGASISSGIPSGREMIWEFKEKIIQSSNSELFKSIINTENENDRKKLISSFFMDEKYPKEGDDSEYSRYFELCFDSIESRKNYISRKVRDKNPKKGYQILGKLLIEKYINQVWTTNFDHLIEAGYKYHNKHQDDIKEIGLNLTESINSLAENDIPIFKLHGDERYDKNLKNTLQETNRLSNDFKKIFLERTKNKGLIFVGYSGADESIMSVLEQGIELLKNGIIWFYRKEDNLSDKVKHLMDHACDINPNSCIVSIEGFDEALIKFEQYIQNKSVRDNLPLAKKISYKYENIVEKIVKTENYDESLEIQGQHPVRELITKINKRCYLLKGIQGIGKTAEIEHLYFELEKEQKYSPFIMDLANFQGIFDLPLSIQSNPIFLLLDNLERIDRLLLIDLIKAINVFLSKNINNKILIAGRPLSFIDDFINLIDPITIRLLPQNGMVATWFKKDEYYNLNYIPFYKNQMNELSSSIENNSIINNIITNLLQKELDNLLWSKKITHADFFDNTSEYEKLLMQYAELAHFLYIENRFSISKKDFYDYFKPNAEKNNFYTSAFLDIDENNSIRFSNKIFFEFFCAYYYCKKSVQEIKKELFFLEKIKINAYPIIIKLLFLVKENVLITRFIITQLKKQSEAYIFLTNYRNLDTEARFNQYLKIIDEFNSKKELIYYGRFHESNDIFSTISSLADKMFDLLPENKQLEAIKFHIQIVENFLKSPNENDLNTFCNSVILLGFGEEKRWNEECQKLLKQISIPILKFFIKHELAEKVKGLLSSLVVFFWYKSYGWTKDWTVHNWKRFISEMELNTSDDFYTFLDENDYKLKRKLFIHFNDNPDIWKLLIPLTVNVCLSDDIPGCAACVPSVLDDDFKTPVLHFDNDLFYFRDAIKSQSARITVQNIIEIANQISENATKKHSRDFETRELSEDLSNQYFEKISQITTEDVPILYSIIKNVLKDNNGLYAHNLIRYIQPLSDEIKLAIYSCILNGIENKEISSENFSLWQPMVYLLKVKDKNQEAIKCLLKTKSVSTHLYKDIFFFCKRDNDDHPCKEYCNEKYESEFPEDYAKEVAYNKRKTAYFEKIAEMRKKEVEFILSPQRIISEIDRILDYLDSDQNPFNKDSERLDLIYLEPEHTLDRYEFGGMKDSEEPEIFSEFVIKILRDASYNDSKEVNREHIKADILTWGNLEQNFWRFFFWFYVRKYDSDNVKQFFSEHPEIVFKIKQSMELEFPGILNSQDITVFDGGKNEYQIVPFVYYLNNLYENKLPDFLNPHEMLKFVAFPAWCLSEYGVHTTGEYKWGNYESVFDWLSILLNMDKRNIINHAISIYSKLKTDISRTQIISYLCESITKRTFQSDEALSLIIQESIQECTYGYKSGDNLKTMNYTLQNFWNKYEQNIINRIEEYIDFTEYKHDEKNYCRKAMADYIIRQADTTKKKKIISIIKNKERIDNLTDDRNYLLSRLGEEKATIILINQYLEGKKLNTSLYFAGPLFGIEKASNKAFRKMIELFDYTLQKSSDRRHELHSIAVGMINRNVTKKNFKILKKHLSMIVSRKRENNEYFEYVQNYLNEVEQKIYS